MTKNKILAENIKKYRKEKHITQKQLASLIGKTESSVQKYEAGKVDIPNNVLECIAQNLDCTLIQLYGMDSEYFMTRLRETNTDPLLVYLDSLGYKVILGDDGKIFIMVNGQKKPLMKYQHDLLKEQIESYCRFITENIFNSTLTN